MGSNDSPGRDVLTRLGIDVNTRSMLARSNEAGTQGVVRRVYFDLLSRIGMIDEPSRLMELRLGRPNEVNDESLTKRCTRTALKVTNLLERLEEQNATLLTHNASLTQRILVLENEVRGLNDNLSSDRLAETLPPPHPINVADPSVQIESVVLRVTLTIIPLLYVYQPLLRPFTMTIT